ncbi:MAG: hypothetical protein GTN78_02585, partial [Gemmatimonadales bacterium]|nr:hypothetical protein [Gemmatimonadales bacterium]
SAELGTPLWRGQSPGLRLSFRQPMQHEHEAPSYTYSLRIGQWQGRPLDMVSAFVTARDELAVSPELGPPPSSVSMADSHAWMTENHGRDRHIYHMSLLNWRPQEDLIVRNTGVGSLARQHEQRRLLLA